MSRQLALLWGGIALGLIALSPWAGQISSGLWPCTFKSLTGIACPTCGTTRAALALARFDVATALLRYPLPALGWIGFLLGGLGSGVLALAGRTPPAVPVRLPGWARMAIVTAIVSNWAYAIATGV